MIKRCIKDVCELMASDMKDVCKLIESCLLLEGF